MDKMYTEFKNANSSIAELLHYVKRGVALDHAEASASRSFKGILDPVVYPIVEVAAYSGLG